METQSPPIVAEDAALRDELALLLEEHRRAYLAEYEHALARERAVPLDEPGDAIDLAERAADREELFAATESARALLQQVEDALQRLADGTFGTCLECGDPIPLERLRAVPWATLCARHQEEHEAWEGRRAFGAPRRKFPATAGEEEEEREGEAEV